MGFRYDNSGTGGAIANFSPDFVGTLALPVNVGIGGLDIMSAINQSFFVTAYVTATGDVTVTTNPQITPGYAEGQILTLWYIGSGSLTFRDGDGLESNGDQVLVEGYKVQYQWDGVGLWNQISKNQ